MKSNFMKHGEEAYALSAKVEQILKDAGFRQRGVMGTFVHKNHDVRIIKRPGTRQGSIMDFGLIERQIRNGDDWLTKNVMRTEDFANAENPMKALEEADEIVPKRKPPKPTPYW